MIRKILRLFALITFAESIACFSPKNQKGVEIPGDFAPEGMVAYAASYTSDIENEPKYATQNSTTFQYLNLGSTLSIYRGDSVKVGIIDSGINYDHEDFMVSGSTKVKGASKYYSYQNSSWVYYGATSHGYSYIDDTLGHGTNVAATVAAAVNSVGGLGLAPNVELYVYKVTNSSNGYEFGAIQNALMDAQNLGLDVINMSFQSYEHAVSYNSSSMAASSGCSSVLTYYLNQAYYAGITLVGAAGNYNTDEPSYPGSNNHVINVGSLNSTGTGKAPFSNYGSTIDLVSPGYVYVADEASNTAYTSTQGTSFSAPLVTAAIALYKQKNPSATPAQIESALYASCDPIDSGSTYSNWAGNGSLNVAKFLGISENSPTEIVINNQEVVNEELSLEVGDTFDLDWTVNGNGTFDDSVNFYALEDNGVLSVNSSGRITALSAGSDYVVIESNADPNVYASIYVTVTASSSPTPTVSSVTVSPGTLSLDLNGTKTGNLSATVNGTNNPSQNVTWSSSNTSVATVSGSGLVTAKSTGTVTITATSEQDGTKAGTCTVTVSDSAVHVTGVSLNKNSSTIYVGASEPLTATVSPNNASDKSVSWDSSDPSVATVNSSGVVTGIAVGNSTITVTTTDGSYKATCSITVSTSSDTLAMSALSSSDSNISAVAAKSNGSNTPITATVNSHDGVRMYANNTLTITSSNYITSFTIAWYKNGSKAFASVTVQSGGGTYTHAASSGNSGTWTGNSKEIVLKVGSSGQIQLYQIQYTIAPAKTLSSISISGYTTSFTQGDAFSFGGTVTAHYGDSSTGDVTNSATFTGYNMTTLGNQTVTVSYTEGSTTKTETYSITINEGTLSSISVSGMTTSYSKNDTFSFDGTCTVTFNNGYQKSVTPTSVSSPDMTMVGNKTVTVSFTQNGVTASTTYEITVNSNRTVIEVTEATGYVAIGTITFPNNTQTISVNTLDISTGGYTGIESNSIRLGSSSNTGTVTVTSTTSNITKIVVSAKSYGTDANVELTIDGSSNSITSSYSNYYKEFSTATNSVSIATTEVKKRAYVESITVYKTKTIQTETNISTSSDCIGLETFIDTYMHMDYVQNLGYCKDNDHHYYSSAKTAFNNLNVHQRSLFTSNSAYLNEWNRLRSWASANGESLNQNNQLGARTVVSLIKVPRNDNKTIILIFTMLGVGSIFTYWFVSKRRKCL